MDKEPITLNGLNRLEEELVFLKEKKRPEIVAAISEARSHGDLKENAEYHAAKEEQSHNETKIMELEDTLSRAEVIDPALLSGDEIKFSATVLIVDEETDIESEYKIVGEVEADFKSGKISIQSPLARALIGKSSGDSVEVNTPGGGKSYEILKIKYI